MTDQIHWYRILRQFAEQHGDRKALAFREHSITYEELFRLSCGFAAQLKSRGVFPGDFVGAMLPPRPEAMISFFGTLFVGGIWVGINTKFRPREIAYLVEHCKPKVIFAIDQFDGTDFRELLGEVESEHLNISWLGDALADNLAALCKQDLAPEEAAAIEASATIDDPTRPGLLIYTSGTTGQPKGALIRERETIYRSNIQATMFPTQTPPVAIFYTAINNVGGLVYRGLSQIVHGGTLVYQERFNASTFRALMEKHKVNILLTGPAALKMILEAENYDYSMFSQLDWLVFAGASIPESLIESIARQGPSVGAAYGMTETVASCCFSVPPNSYKAISETIGKPYLPGELRIVNDQGDDVVAGEVGELQVRKEHCMIGYFNNPEATRDTFTEDGWLKTGDLASFDAQGNIVFAGRSKEMFKSGGYNVFPREVEDIIDEHPAVAMSVVVAIDDEKFQQVGAAFIKLKQNAALSIDGIKAHCKENLSNYKVPKLFFFIDDMPTLPTGKIDRKRLSEQANRG